jgi:transposase, IS30 family
MSRQLTESDRAVLAQLLQLDVPKKEIARRLNKHRSTIYRELARNTGPVGYIPEEAQQRTDIRRWVNHRVRKMDDSQVRHYVCQRLEWYWSPDQIAGRSRREFRRQPRRQISRQTVYQWIRKRPLEERRTWRGHLRFGVRRKHRQNAGRMRCGSMGGRPSWLHEGATVTGKEIRSWGVVAWAAYCR